MSFTLHAQVRPANNLSICFHQFEVRGVGALPYEGMLGGVREVVYHSLLNRLPRLDKHTASM